MVLTPDEITSFTEWFDSRSDLNLIARFQIISREKDLFRAPSLPTNYSTPHLAVLLLSDEQALPAALALRRPNTPFRTATTPILVHQIREDHFLMQLANLPLSDRSLANIVAFGGLIRADALERVLDRKGDEKAIALHGHYLDAARNLPPGSPVAIAAWDELPENLRSANRASVEHFPVMLAAIGTTNREANLDHDKIERLAMMEHRRWIADRIDRGWRYGPARDNAGQVHPSIAAFDTLAETEKEKDRNAVNTLNRIYPNKES